MNICGSVIRFLTSRFFLQKAVAGLVLGLLSLTLRAAEPVQLYAIALDYRLDERGSGHYNKFLVQLKESGLSFEIMVRPMTRSLESFENDSDSCVFPATIHALKTNNSRLTSLNLISGDPVDYVGLRILTDTTKPIIHSVSELQGKRIAIPNGINPQPLLGLTRVDIEPTSDEYIRLKMLDAGRLDAVLSFTPDILLAAEDLGLPVPHYDPDLALFEREGVSLVCHDSAVSRAFVEHFNKALAEMKASGQLQRTLGRHAVIAP